MEEELTQLKKVFRSLAVSSPVQVDLRSLLKDYRTMMGQTVPIHKWGYRDPLLFLKERCQDCFLISGPTSNPLLTLIVPDSIKHIDKFVQKQKVPAACKFKGKRRSVEQSVIKPKPTLIADTFKAMKEHNEINFDTNQKTNETREHNFDSNKKTNENREDNFDETREDNFDSNKKINETRDNKFDSNTKTNETREQNFHSNKKTNETTEHNIDSNKKTNKSREHSHQNKHMGNEHILSNKPKDNNRLRNNVTGENQSETNENDKENKSENSDQEAYSNFCAKRMASAAHVRSFCTQSTPSDGCTKTSREDGHSGPHTSSTSSSTKNLKLEQLKHEIMQLISDHPQGVWCADLIRLYRERHKRELSCIKYGYSSVLSMVCTMQVAITRPRDADDWLLTDPRLAPEVKPTPAPAPRSRGRPKTTENVDAEDALPGIVYDPEVFPADCMHFAESIPTLGVGGLAPGALLDVIVGEVYSPSHFWLLRLGEAYDIAMEEIMDEMTRYYKGDEGKERFLARGAIKVGQYCASVFDGDYHRSLIVKIVDTDTVKVRHVDYGTVDPQPVRELKPLLRRWASLPAQATRARLAGLRPAGGARRWTHAANTHFLNLVRNKRLVANVVAVDPEDNVIEVVLVDTSTEDDVYIGNEIIKAMHADPRCDSVLRTSECYLCPRFDALENGDTPNFAEIYKYLMDGIELDCVEEYRRHVPFHVPADSPPPPDEDAPPPGFDNRVPLLPCPASTPPSDLAGSSQSPNQPEVHSSTSDDSTASNGSSDVVDSSPVPAKNVVCNGKSDIASGENCLPRHNNAPRQPNLRPPPGCHPLPIPPNSPMGFFRPQGPTFPMGNRQQVPWPPFPMPSCSPMPCYPSIPSAFPYQNPNPSSISSIPQPPPSHPMMPSDMKLSVDDYHVFNMLNGINPQIANRYIARTLELSMAEFRLRTASQMTFNPLAPDFHSSRVQIRDNPPSMRNSPSHQGISQPCRVPPGFEK